MNPHLINGFKYDIRLYVVVTCFDPVKIYLYHDGLVRFATHKFSTKNVNDKFVHLTNYSINKLSDDFNEPEEDCAEDDSASKWSFKHYLE